MPRRPSEDEYFAREDELKKAKLAREQKKHSDLASKEALRAQHAGHCPQCGQKLSTAHMLGGRVLRCLDCRGAWLEAPSIDSLVEKARSAQGEGIVDTLLDLLRPTK